MLEQEGLLQLSPALSSNLRTQKDYVRARGFTITKPSPLFLCYLRLELRIQRQVEAKTTFHSGREGMKSRDIHSKYPAEKAQRLIQLLYNKGLWYWDEDFPQDEEDC